MKPCIVFGLPDTLIRIWELIPNIEVMINSIRWRWGRPKVHKVWVDSGGYQIMIKGIDMDVKTVAEKYRNIEGDIFISLDKPPQDLCSKSKDLVEYNIKNFEYLYERIENKKIVPVIHCYKSDLLLYAIDVYSSYNVDFIAYGGAVPPSMAKAGRGSRTIPLLALAIIRKTFSGWIHALGIGGTPALYKALSILRVNSMDSSSWRTKAAYGKVMIPGLGERYVGNGKAVFGRKDLSKEDLDALENALEKSGFPYLDRLEDLLKTFRGRCLINAWIMKHFIDIIYNDNGFMWMIKYANMYESYSVEELVTLLDKKLKSRSMN
ncbi:MAG: hypothetical protein QXW20_07140 [Ignisphaera sp.]